MLISSTKKALQDLKDIIVEIDQHFFSKPCNGLSQATIGEHTRHIIELFQCLLSHYRVGIVDYDQRKRDLNMQTNVSIAVQAIEDVILGLDQTNKILQLHQKLCGEQISIQTNYERELLYNLEHCIHHQALIKVALLEFGFSKIKNDFGVANSTLEYRKECAQ